MRSFRLLLQVLLVTGFVGWGATSAVGETFDVIEIRLVDRDDGVDGPRLALEGTDRVVEVEPEPRLSSPDFVGVGQVGRTEGKAGFEVQLTPAGSKKLERLSTENVGRSLAVIVDGRLLMTPKILDPIVADGFLITVSGSEADARALASEINDAIARMRG